MNFLSLKLKNHNMIIRLRVKELIFTFFIFSVFIVSIIYYVNTMFKNYSLDRHGIPIEAIVTKYSTHSSKGSTSYYIQYKFKTEENNNEWYTSANNLFRESFWNFVSEKEWDDSVDREKINIIYLKNNPKINKPLENKNHFDKYVWFTLSMCVILLISGPLSYGLISAIYEDYNNLKVAIANNELFIYGYKKGKKKSKRRKYFLWDIKKSK